MDLSPRSIENQKLVRTKKYVMLMSCIPEPALQSCDIGQRIVFLDRCQLIITWSSNSKLETDSIFLGLPASKFAISHLLTSRGGGTYGRFCIVACEQALQYVEENTTIKTNKSGLYKAFSLARPASMLIYWRKRKCLHKKRIQLPKDYLIHQHGLRFIVLKHQHGRHDVMWNAQNFKCNETRLRLEKLGNLDKLGEHFK